MHKSTLTPDIDSTQVTPVSASQRAPEGAGGSGPSAHLAEPPERCLAVQAPEFSGEAERGGCPRCQAPVVRSPRGRPRKFCSSTCQEAAKHDVRVEKERHARLGRRVGMVCLTCGSDISARRAAKYCSLTCANRDSDRFHVRRLREAAQADGSRPTVAKVARRDGWTCALCHLAVDSSRRYPDPAAPSLDHIAPLSLGGAHSMSNAQLAHLGCNRSKGAQPEVANHDEGSSSVF